MPHLVFTNIIIKTLMPHPQLSHALFGVGEGTEWGLEGLGIAPLDFSEVANLVAWLEQQTRSD